MVCVSRVPGSALRVASVLRASPVVAFCGSRRGFVGRGELAFLSVVALLPPGGRVLVGCARGVDEAVRVAFPGCLVFRVQSFVRSGFGLSRACFARRSAALVGSCVAAGGVLVAFPAEACPAGLVPGFSCGACFGGFGSGSWSSVALAVGSGGRVLLWLPAGAVPPAWGFAALGGGWWSVG